MSEEHRSVKFWRKFGAFTVIALAVGYAALVLAGHISQDRRIDTPILALVGLSCLIAVMLTAPQLLESVLEFKAFGISLKLKQVELAQKEQQDQIAAVSLTITALLPPAEQGHLLKLYDQFTQNYSYREGLRRELAHLRSLKLIAMQSDPAEKDGRKHLGALPHGTFDLAEFVKLTDEGARWAKRIKYIDAAAVHSQS